jgi:hypothetical protein
LAFVSQPALPARRIDSFAFSVCPIDAAYFVHVDDVRPAALRTGFGLRLFRRERFDFFPVRGGALAQFREMFHDARHQFSDALRGRQIDV